MAKKKPMQPTKKQTDKFFDKARELGCDESEAAFDEKLKRLAKAKPKREANDEGERLSPKK